jgi:hypothetical protein
MKLTIKKLLLATIIIILLDITYVWIRKNYGLMNWISPKTLKFWAKDFTVVLAWIIYLFEKIKSKPDSNLTSR